MNDEQLTQELFEELARMMLDTVLSQTRQMGLNPSETADNLVRFGLSFLTEASAVAEQLREGGQ